MLEHLPKLESISGAKVSEGGSLCVYGSGDMPPEDVVIDRDANTICFRLQRGPIKEVGVNGCQIDAMIEAARLMIEGANAMYPCLENKSALSYLQLALTALESRRLAREKRGVEGTSNV